MSLLYYNGITLQVCKVLKCDRHFIYDGPTYLYSKWNLHVRCLYNPFATSYDLQGIGGEAVATARVPVSTDSAIRHRLATPRQRLIIGVGHAALLVSPQPGFGVDQANGPQPLACNVVKIAGTKSFIVDYAIQTCLRECNLETATYPSIFLSHLWEMSHSMDDDFLMTRTIKGRVIFDAARVSQAGVVPDQYRGALFHPVPTNCQRYIDHITLSDDNNTVAYQIRDEEQAVNLGLDLTEVGVTRIEASHNATFGQPAEFTQRAAIAGALFGAVAAGIGGFVGARFLGLKPANRRLGRLVGAAGGLATGALSGIEKVIGITPMMTHTIDVRVYGDGTAAKSDLQTVAMRIIQLRLQGVQMEGFGSFGHESAIEWDLKQRAVEVVYKQISAQIPIQLLGGPDIFYPTMNQADRVAGLLEPGDGTTNALPVGDNISRGTHLEMIVAQALASPCSNVGLPVGPPFTDQFPATVQPIDVVGPLTGRYQPV